MKYEDVTIIYSNKIDKDKLDEFDKMLIDNISILIKGVIEADDPKELIVEIHLEEEYGEDLSSNMLFDKVEKEFENNKPTTGLDYCRIWKLNEYIVVAGIKK